MSAADIVRDDHRERIAEDPPARVLAPGLLGFAAGLIVLWPYTAVIAPGGWITLVVILLLEVMSIGTVLRVLLRTRTAWARDAVTPAIQTVAAACLITLTVAPEAALFGVLPTGSTVEIFKGFFPPALEQVLYGSAPLDDTAALSALIVLGFAVLAVLLDQLIAHGWALLAGLLAAVTGSIPMIAAMSGADIGWFLTVGALILVLLWDRSRHDQPARRPSSAPAAIAVSLCVLTGSVVLTPSLPVSLNEAGSATGVTVNAALRLGDDLRRPAPVEVMTLATAANRAPYLRLTTLSRFDGSVWHPDRPELNPLAEGFPQPGWNDDIADAEQQTSIRILRLSSSWLPVPFAATDVDGIGAPWQLAADNRTVVARGADAAGNDYTVASLVPAPTLEQIRASDAVDSLPGVVATARLPRLVRQLAADVTAAESTDYDRLIALQSWFRNQFTYSLETPVADGFDGTGAEAVVRFLEKRSGYCIHFAGAFALMAQSLDMPVRIVVGYLPGLPTANKRGEETVYSVRSDQLHSWPEVHFAGIGWVAFEPTASLGVPTRFVSAESPSSGEPAAPAPAPTTTPGAIPTSMPNNQPDDLSPESAGEAGSARIDPTPMLTLVLCGAGVALLPVLVRRVVRSIRLSRARRGDALAAWREVQDTLSDLRIPGSPGETLRMRAAVLAEHGADRAAAERLVHALEASSYARATPSPVDLRGPALQVITGLAHGADRRSRIRALLLPRSLLLATRATATAAATA